MKYPYKDVGSEMVALIWPTQTRMSVLETRHESIFIEKL
jgi:hypothetical protein